LQIEYSNQIFSYFKENRGDENEEFIFSSFVMMWGNTGHAEHLDELYEMLDDDSPLWNHAINSLGNLYHRNEDLEAEAFIEKLHELEHRLTDPISLSQLMTYLTRHYKREGDNEMVLDYARKMIELNASDWFVDFGLGEIYELESLQIGQPAPELIAETIRGEPVSLEDNSGRFVLLEFWGSWCGPCIPEIPYLKTVHESFEDDQLVVIGIALDRDTETVEAFMEEHEMTWPQILQTDMFNGELVNAFNIGGVPAMYLIGPDGVIVTRNLRGEEMVEEVSRLVSEYFE
ncbi:MAG: TlpA family protein disulfide reductase, partial [Balneolaceae bacterium]